MEAVERELVSFNKFFFSKSGWDKCNLVEVVQKLSTLSPESYFKDLVLEFLIRLSQIIYWKSCKLLKEKVVFEDENGEKKEQFKGYVYYNLIPLNNCLFEKRFLPSVQVEVRGEAEEIGIDVLIKVILKVLEREERKQEVVEVISRDSIEDYMQRIKEELEVKGEIRFKSFLKEVGCFCRDKIFDIVYYFLAILFLSYLGYCYLVQNNEEEDIRVYLL